MEVYLSRLPPQFTEQSLNRSLKPVLAELGICDVLCQKNLHKKWAIVTFLERSDGQRFLNRYGDIRHGNQHQPRLMLANLLVSCKESHNKPSPYVLRCLAKTKNDRSNPQTAPRPPEAVIKFTLMGLQCGYLTYTPSGQLYFKPELSWSWWSKSSLRLINKTIVIKYNEWRLEIPFISVYELIVSTYARGPATLTFTLMESPRLYSSNVEDNLLASINTLALTNGRSKMNVAPLTRLTALDELHEDIVGYCLVYQVSVPFDGNFESSVDAIRARGDIAVSYYNFPDDRRFMMAEYSFPFYLDSFNTQLAFSCLERKEAVLSDDEKAHGTGPKLSTSHGEGKVIPFDLAYQLQAMVQNGYLLPTVAEQLLGRIMAINRASHDGQDSGSANTTASAPTRITGAAVRRFLDRIPFPGPYVPADSFSVDHLVSGLLAEQRSLDAEEAHMRYQMFLDADMAGMDGAEAMKRRDDNAQVPICRILVTPTRVLLQGPELEAQNPVLRRYARSKASTSGRSVTETFVRVSFADEDGSSIRLTPRVNNDKVFAKFKETLDKGIMLYSQLLRGPVNSVLYRFLGFSGSSLRAHTAWLSNIEYEETIRELGDFSRLRSPARCAARIGQAFSETPWTVPLVLPGGDRVEVKRIEDVKIRDPLTGSERFFSDGCATISPAMNRHILNYLPRTKGSPTLYQFRMAGAKGMLSVDASLGEDALVLTLRDSMVKFGGGDESYLDICDMANRPLDLVLNRQMIKILEDMGAPDSWFFKLQERAIAEIRLVCNDARRLSKYLEHKSIAEHAAFAGLVRRLHELGIDYKKDRLISSIVEAVVLRELRLLKHKARIPVPLGVTLFGVMDETGFLMEGEVYITYDPDKKRRHMAPPRDRTEVIITRSPALHPGDIQRAVQAVPPPGHPLTYLSNCVVFSQRGLRDLPSQLSGGDLDGDIYNVIWDPDLMISSLHTYQPADYPRVTPVDIGRPVRREDITEFFVKFMRTDQLGVIATRHMILADQRRLGTLDPDAIKLAELHSNAVDFSKSGVDVDLSQMNIRDFKPRFRPDFLEPSAPTSIGRTRGLVEFDALPAIAPAEDHEDDDEVLNYVTFYRSEKLLGRLYRAIDERRIWEQDIRHGEARRIAEGHGDPDIVWQSVATHIRSTLAEWLPDLEWEDKEKVQEAWRIRHDYESSMKSMRRDFSTHPYHPLSELEVFTGYIFNPTTDAQTRQQRDRSAKLKEAFDGLTRWIVQGEIRGRTRARMQSKDASGAATVAASATKTGPAFRLKSAGGSDAHAEYDNDDDSSDSDSGSGALLSVATSIGGSVSGRAAGDGAGHGSNDRSTAAKGVGNHRAETSSAALPKAFDADSWSNVGSYGYISKGNGTQGLASTAVGPERVEALRTAIACFFIALQDGFEDDSDDYYGGGSSSQKRNKVESFKIVAASIALKELEAVVRGLRALRHSREGDDGSSRRPRAARTGGAGGFVGVRG